MNITIVTIMVDVLLQIAAFVIQATVNLIDPRFYVLENWQTKQMFVVGTVGVWHPTPANAKVT
jgi:hypothetical protein